MSVFTEYRLGQAWDKVWPHYEGQHQVGRKVWYPKVNAVVTEATVEAISGEVLYLNNGDWCYTFQAHPVKYEA